MIKNDHPFIRKRQYHNMSCCYLLHKNLVTVLGIFVIIPFCLNSVLEVHYLDIFVFKGDLKFKYY